MNELETLLQRAQALIFDCDGTLVQTPALYAGAWQDAFKAAGHHMEPDWYHARAGMSEHVLLDDFESEHGVTVDRGLTVREMRSAVLERIGEVSEIEIISSIARRFHGKLPMAVASGGPREVVLASLKETGLLPLFDTVVTIDDVAHAKPAPDLFLEAASRLAVTAAQCLVFEDSQQGLEAAHNARMPVVDVNHLIG
ncbi:HAD family phosphatase [Roseibium sp. FZY0029]|uniref:HAD family hydrolase n=1 Tax=Roseibium sp. FZY0029 TaxID=3116647 RepID=UPI002EC2F537|nr:HAD family phosphatase [Roseibium sp. FZY0029]